MIMIKPCLDDRALCYKKLFLLHPYGEFSGITYESAKRNEKE